MLKNFAPPDLKESQIKAIATNQSFKRGQSYFEDEAISNPTRQGQLLWAECYGTDCYYPRAVLGAKDVESSSCTCPYDLGGICKHQVALLLTYIHQRDRIREIPPLPKLLAQRKRSDLIALIEKMVQRYPDLTDFIDILPGSGKDAQPKLHLYQRQAEKIFQLDRMRPMAQNLEALVAQADSFTNDDNWVNAGDIYHCLLNVANEQYDYEVLEVDYNGEVGCVIQDIAKRLVKALENVTDLDRDRHQQWIKTLFDAVLKDIDLGGMDYAYPAKDAVFDHASDDEWIQIEQKIREKIATLTKKSYSTWGRQALVKFLAEKSKQRGENTTADNLILELGTPEQQAYFHLKNKNLEKAVAIAKQDFPSKPGLVTRFADVLLQADAPTLALEFVQFCSQASHAHYSYTDWLVKFYKDHGSIDDYIAMASEKLQNRFSTTDYQGLQAKAEPLGKWKKLRQTLLSIYKKKQHYHWLMEIAILDKNWDQAVTYLNRLRTWNKTPYQEQLATKLKCDRPDLALQLYIDLIQKLIEERGRENYRVAVRHLKEVKSLYRQLKQTPTFKNYIQTLRSQHANLRALQDELNKAGL